VEEAREELGVLREVPRKVVNAIGAAGLSTWSRNGEEVASLGWERTSTSSDRPALRLFYTVAPDTDDPRKIDYLVPLEYTECNFGGHRPWFECPGEGCGERVGKLYKPLRDDLFLCRHCYDLTYESRQQSGTFHFENIVKPFQRQQEAIEELEDGPLTRKKLRKVYDADERFGRDSSHCMNATRLTFVTTRWLEDVSPSHSPHLSSGSTSWFKTT
jgi:hypothetical protein